MSIIFRTFIVENQRVTLNYVKTENHHNTLPERSKVPGTITFQWYSPSSNDTARTNSTQLQQERQETIYNRRVGRLVEHKKADYQSGFERI